MAENQIMIPKFDYAFDRKHHFWMRSELYTGPNGTGEFVPKIDDPVMDWSIGWLQVVEVDNSTGLSKLKPWTPPKSSDEGDGLDLLRGIGPGYVSETWRCYLNTKVIPHTLTIDAKLHMFSVNASYIKVFKGTDISETGKVISKNFDASGNLLGENIPLEVLAMPDHNNFAIKAPAVGYTTEQFPDGEVLWAVVYNAEGGQVSEAKLVVRNSSFVRGVEASRKYVSSIELISPFMSKTDPNMVEFPINVNLESITLVGRVNYSDGTRKLVPIDGVKMRLDGMKTWVSTVLGHKQPLSLVYILGSDESAADSASVFNNAFMQRSYVAKTTPVDGAYSVKLFCFPCWDDVQLEYQLHWFLYNLTREAWYRVDHLVELAINSVPFNSRKFGVTQKVAFAIDLSQVDGRFAKYRHVQQIELALLAQPTEDRTWWTITHEPLHPTPYGVEVFARFDHISGGNYNVRLDESFSDLDVWLERFYYDTFPVSNDQIEVRPPRPTHFVLDANGLETEYPIAAFNQDLLVNTTVLKGQNIYLHWIAKDGITDHQLGVSGVSVRHTQDAATLP